MIAATFGVGQVVYSILWFVLFFIEIWLMISVFIDIFRSHDLQGWAKALWVLLVLVASNHRNHRLLHLSRRQDASPSNTSTAVPDVAPGL